MSHSLSPYHRNWYWYSDDLSFSTKTGSFVTINALSAIFLLFFALVFASKYLYEILHPNPKIVNSLPARFEVFAYNLLKE